MCAWDFRGSLLFLVHVYVVTGGRTCPVHFCPRNRRRVSECGAGEELTSSDAIVWHGMCGMERLRARCSRGIF